MEIRRTLFDNAWIVVRNGFPVPLGLTGYFDTKEEAQAAIDWYYSQTKFN